MQDHTLSEACMAPKGMWRVIQSVGHPENRKGYTHVGDFKDFPSAADACGEVKRPFARTVYNDQGISVECIVLGR